MLIKLLSIVDKIYDYVHTLICMLSDGVAIKIKLHVYKFKHVTIVTSKLIYFFLSSYFIAGNYRFCFINQTQHRRTSIIVCTKNTTKLRNFRLQPRFISIIKNNLSIYSIQNWKLKFDIHLFCKLLPIFNQLYIP